MVLADLALSGMSGMRLTKMALSGSLISRQERAQISRATRVISSCLRLEVRKMLNEQDARQIAENFVRDEIQPRVGEELVIAELTEFSTSWVAVYNTRKFVETGNFLYALAGNGPLIISQRTGTTRIGLTSQPVEEQLDRD
jgi:hypothetical protein